ncbi:hypothetical protein AOG23_03810 [Rhizobium acidisoli]|nr:hypothetical protein AOG23_03810 [Rhizobium acidisoli]
MKITSLQWTVSKAFAMHARALFDCAFGAGLLEAGLDRHRCFSRLMAWSLIPQIVWTVEKSNNLEMP